MSRMFSNYRMFVQEVVNRLKVGQRVVIDRCVFEEAFSDIGFPSIYRNPIESFLSKQIGSGWGRIRCVRNLMTGDYIISKHQESNKRYYIDPDRAWMFDKQPDGTLKLKDYLKNDTTCADSSTDDSIPIPSNQL